MIKFSDYVWPIHVPLLNSLILRNAALFLRCFYMYTNDLNRSYTCIKQSSCPYTRTSIEKVKV